MLTTQDIKTLAEMGRALWLDPNESQRATAETLSVVTLLDLTRERALERVAAALLERVAKRGTAANMRANLMAGLSIDQPFYRLEPEERFLLTALHLGRWSYARLARVFGEPAEVIEALAWKARVRLAQVNAYPAGAPLSGPNCPEYDALRPWTQRFMDEEIAVGRERVFLQNHLMACDSCRAALGRCREVYYAVERLLPRLGNDGDDQAMIGHLQRISRRNAVLKAPVERTFGESLAVFSRRTDVRWVLAFLAALIAWKLWRG